ncbi:hypothetical protein WMY93_011381 [Mugilogobius chulae]|uniref:ribonuclease H n=1 Tax=Mugilogobius chulae TaxID=88201 RepID=A0AAW0P2I1_9GOBI
MLLSWAMAEPAAVCAAGSGAFRRVKPEIYTTPDGKVIVEDELLNFLVIKLHTLTQDEVIMLVTNNFSSERIEESKKILFDVCPKTTLRNVAHKGPQKDINNVKACIKVLNECGGNIPRFVSYYLDDLPVVGFGSMDASALLSRVEQLSREVLTLSKTLQTQVNVCENLQMFTKTIDCRVAEIEQSQNRTVPEASTADSVLIGVEEARASVVPVGTPKQDNALADGEASKEWSTVVKEGRRVKMSGLDKSLPARVQVRKERRKVTGITGTCTGSSIQAVTTKRVSLFATRFDPVLEAATLHEYLTQRLNNKSVICKKISAAHSRYSSFHVTVDCNDIAVMYDPDLWPAGAYIRRYYEARRPGSTHDSGAQHSADFYGAGESTTDLDSKLIKGRISGGVAILWRKNYDCMVKVLRLGVDWAIGLEVVCNDGSQVTMMSQSLFRRCMGGMHVTNADDVPWLTLRAANGLQIPYVGYVTVNCEVGGVCITEKGIIIVEDSCLGADKGILDMNIIQQLWSSLTQGNHPGLAAFKTTLSLAEGKAWSKAFMECQKVVLGGPRPAFEGVAKLPRQPPVIIPPHTEMVLWMQVTETNTNCTVTIEPLPNSDTEWRVGRTLATFRDGKVPCRLCNPNPYSVEVPQRQPLAWVTEVNYTEIQEDQELVLNSIEPDVIEVAVRRVVGAVGTEDDVHSVISLQGDGLTEEQQTKMTTLLQRWKSVFSRHDEDFGRTGVVKHQIPTGMAPPSRERYRPVPPSLYPELRSLLKNMLESGVVRESSSPWAAPIVLVRKKDGSWRFCVDYRRLNAVTHKDAYPLPRIEESLTGLKAAKWYLDLASGYWQVEVEPADQEKTAFTTPFGLYEFERMPFGLCNAPATFQRLMQRCLGNMVNDFLLIYLDDVVVFSADFDSHLAHLEEVFRKLSDHGLKLQPRKCCLFQKSVTYLGHVISEAGYYQRFISGFSKIALPLNALTHGIAHEKTAPVTWSSDCQQAFDQLKKALINAPVLAYADFSLPFRLYTDASFEGLGAVLAQVQDGKERVIAYASRSLQPAERNDQNYSSFKLELLALKWAVTDKFKDYLYGAEFIVFTDNNPLVHLDTARLGAVEQRWVAQLANFNYTLKYRPGTQNRNRESRRLDPAPPTGTETSIPTDQ